MSSKKKNHVFLLIFCDVSVLFLPWTEWLKRLWMDTKYSFLSSWLVLSALLYIFGCWRQRWIPWLQNKLIKFQFSELQATAVFLWSIKLSWSEIIKPPHFTNLSFWDEEPHRKVLTPLCPLKDQSPSPFSIALDDFSSLKQLAQAFPINVIDS